MSSGWARWRVAPRPLKVAAGLLGLIAIAGPTLALIRAASGRIGLGRLTIELTVSMAFGIALLVIGYGLLRARAWSRVAGLLIVVGTAPLAGLNTFVRTRSHPRFDVS